MAREKQIVNSVIDDSDISCDAELCAAHTGCKYFNPNKKSNVNHCIGGLPLQLRQRKGEPVSEGLKEAASQYPSVIRTISPQWVVEIEKAFKAGAQWQKEQLIDKTCKWLKSYRQDTHDGICYIAGIVNDETIEDFRKYIKGE